MKFCLHSSKEILPFVLTDFFDSFRSVKLLNQLIHIHAKFFHFLVTKTKKYTRKKNSRESLTFLALLLTVSVHDFQGHHGARDDQREKRGADLRHRRGLGRR